MKYQRDEFCLLSTHHTAELTPHFCLPQRRCLGQFRGCSGALAELALGRARSPAGIYGQQRWKGELPDASLWSLWLGAGLKSEPGPGHAFLLFLKVVKAAGVSLLLRCFPFCERRKLFMSWRELLPPWLVIVAGLTGIVLLCVSTKDVPVAPLSTKVRGSRGVRQAVKLGCFVAFDIHFITELLTNRGGDWNKAVRTGCWHLSTCCSFSNQKQASPFGWSGNTGWIWSMDQWRCSGQAEGRQPMSGAAPEQQEPVVSVQGKS